MAKGLDNTFLHYGIRKGDLEIIRALCDQNNIDADWVINEILKPYHAKKVEVIDLQDRDIENIIKKAIEKIPQQ